MPRAVESPEFDLMFFVSAHKGDQNRLSSSYSYLLGVVADISEELYLCCEARLPKLCFSCLRPATGRDLWFSFVHNASSPGPFTAINHWFLVGGSYVQLRGSVAQVWLTSSAKG